MLSLTEASTREMIWACPLLSPCVLHWMWQRSKCYMVCGMWWYPPYRTQWTSRWTRTHVFQVCSHHFRAPFNMSVQLGLQTMTEVPPFGRSRKWYAMICKWNAIVPAARWSLLPEWKVLSFLKVPCDPVTEGCGEKSRKNATNLEVRDHFLKFTKTKSVWAIYDKHISGRPQYMRNRIFWEVLGRDLEKFLPETWSLC